MSLENIQFTIVALQKETVQEFQKVFGDLKNFEVKRTNILQVTTADCIVSPANSYGMMDGGVDGPINYALDYIDQRLVRPSIQKYFYGEQPVGTCMILDTGKNNYKYLAHVPTMRIPKDVTETTNAYIAMRALLTGLLNHNKKRNDIKTILMTGFCCGSGHYSAERAAKEMRLAYDMIQKNLKCSWDSALSIEARLTKINPN